jgi:hypothetical protein
MRTCTMGMMPMSREVVLDHTKMSSESAQRATIAKRLREARDIVDECRAMAKHVHLDLNTVTAIFKCESALTVAIEEVSP